MRPFAQEFFRFWPDGEDLLWAKSVWPAMQDAGLFADMSEEADSWTRSRLLALAILYVESALACGVADYQRQSWLDRTWLLVAFGSPGNLDEALHEVRLAMDQGFDIEAAPFYVSLLRSIRTGSGTPADDPDLVRDLEWTLRMGLDALGPTGGRLAAIWIGGWISFDELTCLP